MTKKLHNKHVPKSEQVANARGHEDVPLFKYFNGRKYRAVMHGMPLKIAKEQAKQSRLHGFYARLVVYMGSHWVGKNPEPSYALYVCKTQSGKERDARRKKP